MASLPAGSPALAGRQVRGKKDHKPTRLKNTKKRLEESSLFPFNR